MHRRHLLSAAALAGAGLAAPAVLRAAPIRSPDVRIVGETLRALHPGLRRYLAPGDFEAGLARLDHQWRDAPSLEARFLNLTAFLARVRCGHTYASLYNQKRAVADRLFTRADRLPLSFRWIGGAMIVTGGLPGADPPPVGSEILSVEGVPARTLLARMTPLVRADGGNDGKRRALLGVEGLDDIETFDVLYGLLYGPPASGRFHIRFRPAGTGRIREAELAPIDLAGRKAFKSAPDPRSNAPIWDWAVDADGIARLNMPGWALYNSRWDWRTWLNDRLDSLGGARGLIIDLRANEGGNDCGDDILARRAGRDIPLPRVLRLVRYRKTPADLDPFLDTWDDGFRDWGEVALPHDDRFFRLNRAGDADVIAASDRRISTPLAVLIGPQNSSATFQFASLVRASRLGTLVGGTTGGNRRGINGGAFFFVRLPDSGLEFDLPLIGYFPETPQPDAGLVPDIEVVNSASDIAAGRDRVLETARAVVLRA